MKRSLILVFLAIALIAAACGGDDDSGGVASLEDVTTTAESASINADQEQALLDFGQCMRDQGVEFPDPEIDADGNLTFGFDESTNPDDLDRDALLDAGEACQDHLEGVALGFSQLDTSEFDDLFLEYAECMRENGFTDMPDTFDIQDILEGGEPPVDVEDPEFIAANEACQDIFADFTGGFGG